ncbi:Replication protein P [Pseudomonas caricapapayae]|uniref:Replication protein P n=1 Tax=Pseudomonas caricapapayae TaxID=46678 RepID=A0A0P9JYU4_9PSED|nr:replication protein P [Pseudomonas caricapapayae]KAA8689589.1 Replication protein P [Pseudomonas caricapapayae]KPW56674.1 Replication protein P [Pseudomonas caricapapayae]RMM09302.1 Replication protein P [Pseudomonas caricapapayae]
MKPASQLMASMSNQPPEVHRAPVVVSLETAEVVNDLFRRLRGIFPAWRQAWPSTEALAAAKEEWIKEFADEGIRTLEQIEFGIQKCRKLKKPFAPSVGEFIAMCVPGPEDFGMPTVADAWMEALMATYSHEGVKIAAAATGLFDLRSAKQDDKGLRQRFDHNYTIVIRRAQAGQPLDGKILTGIGHDSQKTELELAEEQAEQAVQARIIQQGIPVDGASARALLLARIGRRAGQ